MTPTGAQILINSGMAWKLEGAVGRECMTLIECGMCMLGPTGHRDYWGNYVPSRTEVKSGTLGSRDYVAEMFGEDRAQELELLPHEADLETLSTCLFEEN